MATIAELFVKIGADVSNFVNSMNKSKNSMKEFADTAEKTSSTASKQADTMGKQMENAHKRMQQAFAETRKKLQPFQDELRKTEVGFFDLSQQMGTYSGTTQEFMDSVKKMGLAQKAATDNIIKNNDMMKASFLETVGTMLARSNQSEKIAANFDRMGNVMYSVNKPLLAITNNLENMAKAGQPAVLALSMLGPNANMKELNDMIMLINAGLVRMQAVALAAGIASLFLYGGLHKAAMGMDPQYAAAFTNMIEKLKKAFEPMVQVFSAVMTPVYNFIAAIAELMIKFNEAHPLLAKVIQGFLMLLPALFLILAPLAIGIGYVNGLKASFAALWVIIKPLTMGFATMGGTVVLIAAIIAGLVGIFVHLWKTNENFRTQMTAIWESIKAAVQPLIPVFTQLFGVISGGAGGLANTILPFLSEVFAQVFIAIGQIVAAVLPIIVDLLLTLIPVITNIAQTILPVLLQAAQTIFPALMAVIMAVLPIVVQLFQTLAPVIADLATALIPLILQAVQMVFPIVLQIIQTVLPVVIQILLTLVPIILQIAQEILPLILDAAQEIFPVVLQIVESVIPVVMDLLKSLVPIITDVVIPAFEKILQIVQDVMPQIQQYVEGAMEIVKGVFTAVMPIVSGAVQIAAALIETGFKLIVKTAQWLITLITALFTGDWASAFQKAQEIADSMWQDIVSTFEGIDLAQIGKDIIQGLIDGISSMASGVAKQVSAIANMIPDGVKKFLGIASPSKVMIEQGKWTGIGLEKGLESTIPNVQKTVAALAASPADIAIDSLLAAPKINNNAQFSEENKEPAILNFERMFDGANITVRDDNDLKSLMREMYRLINSRGRGLGVNN